MAPLSVVQTPNMTRSPLAPGPSPASRERGVVFGASTKNRSRLFIAGLVLALLALGCSRNSNPPTFKVHGKVTYKGQPVGEGTVTFQPTKPAPGSPMRPAVGTLKPDGSYELATFSSGDGVVPGEYAVTVRSASETSVENPHAPLVWKTPQKYAEPATSNLKATIAADARGAMELNFTLED